MFKIVVRAGLCALGAICLFPAQVPAQHPAASKQLATSETARAIADDAGSDLARSLQQFVAVFSAVQEQAADQPAVDKSVYEGAIPSMLRELDPHTQFFDPAQFEQLRQMENSEQKGFGSIVSVLPGQVIFLQTLPGTPSNRAGIQAGDELVAINNIAVRSLDVQQIVELLTEARQQKVTIYVRRQDAPKTLAFTLTPELVNSPTVDRAFKLQPGFGYIRVTSWELDTASQLRNAIQELGGNSLNGLIIDLRNNPGGVVKAALDAAAMFLKPGQRILTAKGRVGEPQTADVPKSAEPYRFKLAVVINRKTASASEILSGALQDHDRALVVGEPSYGKGLVQSVLALSGGAGLAITTAFYYTPSGRSIQRPIRNSALSETFEDNEPTVRPTYKTDHGRSVTGGGGIQPDIRVPPRIPTQLETVLDASGAITSFATRYLAKHLRTSSSFEVTPDVLDELKVYLASRHIQPTVAEWSAERSWVSYRLKQELTNQAQGVAKGDEIEAQQDPQIQAALSALQRGTLLADSELK